MGGNRPLGAWRHVCVSPVCPSSRLSAYAWLSVCLFNLCVVLLEASYLSAFVKACLRACNLADMRVRPLVNKQCEVCLPSPSVAATSNAKSYARQLSLKALKKNILLRLQKCLLQRQHGRSCWPTSPRPQRHPQAQKHLNALISFITASTRKKHRSNHPTEPGHPRSIHGATPPMMPGDSRPSPTSPPTLLREEDRTCWASCGGATATYATAPNPLLPWRRRGLALW